MPNSDDGFVEQTLEFTYGKPNAAQLAELYKISPNQEVYFRNVAPGHGLIKVGGALVPFISSMPADTKLYTLLSTNPREVRWD